MHTARCSDRLSCHVCPPPTCHTCLLACMPPSPCHACPLATHAPHHACPPPATHTPAPHMPPPCMPPWPHMSPSMHASCEQNDWQLLGGGVPAPRGVWSRGCLLQGGCLLGGGARSRGGVPGGDPPRTATAAGGTHPIGMHSCFEYISKCGKVPEGKIMLLQMTMESMYEQKDSFGWKSLI